MRFAPPSIGQAPAYESRDFCRAVGHNVGRVGAPRGRARTADNETQHRADSHDPRRQPASQRRGRRAALQERQRRAVRRGRLRCRHRGRRRRRRREAGRRGRRRRQRRRDEQGRLLHVRQGPAFRIRGPPSAAAASRSRAVPGAPRSAWRACSASRRSSAPAASGRSQLVDRAAMQTDVANLHAALARARRRRPKRS